MNRPSSANAVGNLFVVLLLTMSCGLFLTEEERRFVQSGYQEQVDTILAAEPRRQVELYILAMTHVLPPNTGAQWALAERGLEILPFVLERLEREPKDENIQALIELLVTMQINKYYCVGCDEDAMAWVRNAASRVSHPAIRSKTQTLIREFLTPKVTGPTEPVP